MIIYTKRCLACTNKSLWKRVKDFANKNHLTVEERRIGLKKEWAAEAEHLGVELPFAFNGKIALNLNELLEKLL